MSLGGKAIPVTSVRLLAAQGPQLGGREKRMVKVFFTRTRWVQTPGAGAGLAAVVYLSPLARETGPGCFGWGDLATYRDCHRKRTQRTPSSLHFPTLSPIAEPS